MKTSQHIDEDEPIVMVLKHSKHHLFSETDKTQQESKATGTTTKPSIEFVPDSGATLHIVNDHLGSMRHNSAE